MSFIDYYKLLGVGRTSTEKEIKNAYRKLARKFHPDLNPNDKSAEDKFSQINEAHEVLIDPVKRKKYDKYGKDWKHAEEFEKAETARSQQSRSRAQTRTSSDQDYSDFFESMFGGAAEGGRSGGRQVRFKGQDYHAELILDIKEAFTTHQRTLTVDGKNIRLTIPAGVRDGQTIKIKGHGGLGINNGPKGDLFIKFSIENSTAFRRDKDDLYTTVDLDLYKAMLGSEIIINTFDGKVKFKVQPETSNGTKIKLKGKGFPRYKKKGFGDLYVTFELATPKNLTEKEKSLFAELQKLRTNEK
jgi:curved DNA-binding protein